MSGFEFFAAGIIFGIGLCIAAKNCWKLFVNWIIKKHEIEE